MKCIGWWQKRKIFRTFFVLSRKHVLKFLKNFQNCRKFLEIRHAGQPQKINIKRHNCEREKPIFGEEKIFKIYSRSVLIFSSICHCRFPRVTGFVYWFCGTTKRTGSSTKIRLEDKFLVTSVFFSHSSTTRMLCWVQNWWRDLVMVRNINFDEKKIFFLVCIRNFILFRWKNLGSLN